MVEPTDHMVEAVDRALTAAAGTGTGEARAAATTVLGELSALFRMATRGRRQYLRSIEGDDRFGNAAELLRIEIATLESVARVVEGELGPLYNWLPSHLWTGDMLARLYAVHPADETPAATITPPTARATAASAAVPPVYETDTDEMVHDGDSDHDNPDEPGEAL